MEWYEASSHVLTTRGMYWLSRSRYNRAVAAVVNDSSTRQQGRYHIDSSNKNNNIDNKKKNTSDDDYNIYLNQSTLAKAAYFFQLSGDISRLEYIIDSSLSRCMLAVRSCEKFFEHLLLFPTLNSLSKPYLRTNLSSSSSSSSSSSLPSSNTNHSRVNTVENENDTVIELEAALIEANDLLLSINFDDDDDKYTSINSNISTDPYSIVTHSYKYLKIYIEAIECRFIPKNKYDIKKPFMKAIVQLSSLIIVNDDDDDNDAYKEDKKKKKIVVDAVLPMRYWLHTLELIVWFFNSISKVHGIHDDDDDISHEVDQKDMMINNAKDNVKKNDHNDIDDVDGDDKLKKYTTVSKKQAYGLVIALQQLTCSYGINKFIIDANVGNNLRSGDNDNQSNVGFEDSINQLRLGLLGILCHSMIKDNANVYKDSLKDKKIILSPFLRTTLPITATTPTTAYSSTKNSTTTTSKVLSKGKHQLETSKVKIGINVGNSFRYGQNSDNNEYNNYNSSNDERTENDYQLAYEMITGSMMSSIV